MTNDEARMTNEIRNPKSEARMTKKQGLGISHSFVIRIQTLVIMVNYARNPRTSTVRTKT
jgi:hypothetical protein